MGTKFGTRKGCARRHRSRIATSEGVWTRLTCVGKREFDVDGVLRIHGQRDASSNRAPDLRRLAESVDRHVLLSAEFFADKQPAVLGFHDEWFSSSPSLLDFGWRSAGDSSMDPVLVVPGHPFAKPSFDDRARRPAEPDGGPLGLKRSPESLHERDALRGTDRPVAPADTVALQVLLHSLRRELRSLVGDEVTRRAVPGNGPAQESDGPLRGRLAFRDADGHDLSRESVDDGADVDRDGAEEPAQPGKVGKPDVVRVTGEDAFRRLADGLHEAQELVRRQAAEFALDGGAGGFEAKAHEDVGDAARAPRRVLPAEERGGFAGYERARQQTSASTSGS